MFSIFCLNASKRITMSHHSVVQFNVFTFVRLRIFFMCPFHFNSTHHTHYTPCDSRTNSNLITKYIWKKSTTKNKSTIYSNLIGDKFASKYVQETLMKRDQNPVILCYKIQVLSLNAHCMLRHYL